MVVLHGYQEREGKGKPKYHEWIKWNAGKEMYL
jgi:hypothetical protein